MKTLIIASSSTRPDCLKDYIPGSTYVGYREIFTLDLEALAPDNLVLFDTDFLKSRYNEYANRIRDYVASRKNSNPLHIAALYLSPEDAEFRGLLPEERANVAMPGPMVRNPVPLGATQGSLA